MTTTPDADGFTELVDADVPRVDLVDQAANGRTGFLVMKSAGTGLLDPGVVRGLLAKADMSTASINDLPDSAFAYIEPGGTKDEHGRTTPRSLRHFPIHDETHVRNALSRAPQSPLGDKAMPKIRAAAHKIGIEVSKMTDAPADADLDVTTPLADATPGAMGSETQPGSPAWESVDANTARKWTSVLARAKVALDLLSSREETEAAVADSTDIQHAWDMAEAAAAVDYAISILAPFAVAEEMEAECAEPAALIGKALDALDADALGTVEALGHVRKAGRVLSSANEAAIRAAADNLQKVLASLPQAPVIDEPVTKADDQAKEATMDETQVTKAETPAEVDPVTKADDAPPAESDGEGEAKPSKLTAIYDAQGRIVGVVDPASIIQVEVPEGEGPAATEEAAEEPEAEQPPAETSDEPAPAGMIGTPADEVTDCIGKQQQNAPMDEAVLKSTVAALVAEQLAAANATQTDAIAKQAEAFGAVTQTLEDIATRLATVEKMAAPPKVFVNGAMPDGVAPQLRGQDQGAAASRVRVDQVAELRKGLYADDAAERNNAAIDMQTQAIAMLQKIHQGQ